MSKGILRWFWYLSAIAAIYLIGMILYPSIDYSDMPYIVCTYVVVEVLVLVVVLSILRKISLLAYWRLIAYHLVIVAGSFSINFLLSSLEIHLGDLQQSNLLLFSFLSVFMILAFLNIALSKIIFTISFRKVCLIGTTMGLINALMVIITTTFYR
jgi:hypothetical protein